MKHFFISILLLFAACSKVDSDGNTSISSGPSETLFVEWDGEEFRLDNGNSFQIPERHLITDEYLDTKKIIIKLVKPGLWDSMSDLIAQFEAIGFRDAAVVDSAALYRDKQTKSPDDDRPLPHRLNVYLTDVISISDKNYEYNEMDSFINQLTLFDPSLFNVVLNIRPSGEPNQESLFWIIDEIKGRGFKTYTIVNVEQ